MAKAMHTYLHCLEAEHGALPCNCIILPALLLYTNVKKTVDVKAELGVVGGPMADAK